MSLVYYVEDDAPIRDLVIYTLARTGFTAEGFESGAHLHAAMAQQLPDLILLDVMLPGENGFELLARLKSNPETRRIPVMMITARNSENDRVNGLENGADDYVSKPFGVMELIARIKALLRRSSSREKREVLCSGDIIMDTESHTVEAGGMPVQLTRKEYDILQQLLANAYRLVEREQLLLQLWDGNPSGSNHALDTHIQTLRAKLGPSGSRIQTVYGRGYRLTVPEANK